MIASIVQMFLNIGGLTIDAISGMGETERAQAIASVRTAITTVSAMLDGLEAAQAEDHARLDAAVPKKP